MQKLNHTCLLFSLKYLHLISKMNESFMGLDWNDIRVSMAEFTFLGELSF